MQRRKRTSPTIRPSAPHLIESKKLERWGVDYRENGKRLRRFFPTKTAAEKALKDIVKSIRAEGEQAFSVPLAIRVQAAEGIKRLEPFGKNLTQAVDFYVQHLENLLRSVPVHQIVSEFLASKARQELSKVHQDDLRNRFAAFCKTFGEASTRTLTPQQIQSWIDDQGLKAVSANNYRARLFGLFRFGIQKGYLDQNPCAQIEKKKVIHKQPEIYSVDETRDLLEYADPELLPALAIGAFAGVRTSERCRMVWEDIDLTHGLLTVGSEDSKTAQRRTIEMERCLIAWLAPYSGRTGRVFDGNEWSFVHHLQRTQKRAGINKPLNNRLRHSFASYHVAKYGSAERIRNDMGHTSAAVLFANYRALVRPDQAERYFNIFPPTLAKNVVSITA